MQSGNLSQLHGGRRLALNLSDNFRTSIIHMIS